jgi:phosphoribosylamine--glycine ligase
MQSWMGSKDISGIVTTPSCHHALDVSAHKHGEGGIPCFAPTKEAAELEGSKSFAQDFMQRHKIPTAQYRHFSDYQAAKEYLCAVLYRVVIKASGLAAGKGVILPSTMAEATEALEDIMVRGKFGSAGSSIVVEEYLEGEEVSVLTLSDGSHTWSFPPGQDHKRIEDGNKGPNTGGMGVYAPTLFVTAAMMEEIERTILKPTFEGLKSEGDCIPVCVALHRATKLTRDKAERSKGACSPGLCSLHQARRSSSTIQDSEIQRRSR